mmetsp:Transcript_11009/g.24249  ORF Transcript_11009/g.24249 Transcript_11009/m.24249 type:complete len:228 (+) Transcript_11009:1330-2013(+)
MKIKSETSRPNCRPNPMPHVPMAEGADQVPSGRRAMTTPDPPWMDMPKTILEVRMKARPTAFWIILRTVEVSTVSMALSSPPRTTPPSMGGESRVFHRSCAMASELDQRRMWRLDPIPLRTAFSISSFLCPLTGLTGTERVSFAWGRNFSPSRKLVASCIALSHECASVVAEGASAESAGGGASFRTNAAARSHSSSIRNPGTAAPGLPNPAADVRFRVLRNTTATG